MAKKRAFVRYTKAGKIVPGSLIVTTNGGYPVDGLYKEVSVDLCCNDSNGSCCSDGNTDAVIQFPYNNTSLNPILPTTNPHLLFHCGNNSPYTNPLVAAIAIPTESATTVIEICNILNSLYSWLQFSFTPGGGYDELNSITVTYPICFKNAICPNSNVFISIEDFTLVKD